MENIKLEIEQLETMIQLYSDRDRERMAQLENKKYLLEQQLLDLMVMGGKQ
jgi:hypothetical protein